MMKTYKLHRLLVLLCFAISFMGCDLVHEFPDDNPVDPSLIDVEIVLSVDIKFPTDTLPKPSTYALSGLTADTEEGNHHFRYIVDIYETDPNGSTALSNRIKRLVQTEPTHPEGLYELKDTLKLPAKKYMLIAWIDFVDAGSQADKYHNTEDLQNVSILNPYGQYEGYSTVRDAWTAKEIMDLTPYAGKRYYHHTAEMKVKRPYAIYQVITTDIEAYNTYHQTSYASVQPDLTKVRYSLWHPMSLNTYLNAPIVFTGGISYTHKNWDAVPGKEKVIASDYVFVDEKEENFSSQISFDILTADEKIINRIDLKIDRLKQNRLVIVKGEFLTKDLNDNGGVGIDDRFDDEIVIHLPF